MYKLHDFLYFLLLLYYNKSKGDAMTNALKQIKKQHLYAIIKDIYLHQSSTMNELSSRLIFHSLVYEIWFDIFKIVKQLWK